MKSKNNLNITEIWNIIKSVINNNKIMPKCSEFVSNMTISDDLQIDNHFNKYYVRNDVIKMFNQSAIPLTNMSRICYSYIALRVPTVTITRILSPST